MVVERPIISLMGRGSSAQAPGAIVRPRPDDLTDRQRQVLAALSRTDMASAKDLGVSTSAAVSRDLQALEARGYAQRVYNAHGPQIPWWWRTVPPVPDDFQEPVIEPGQIWDESKVGGGSVVFLDVKAGRNKHGLVRVCVKAGEHSQLDTVLPAHVLDADWRLRTRRREVTAWSAQFSCRVHGECTVDMVRTDKCCAICGQILDRL
jgi:hypothetical protein